MSDTPSGTAIGATGTPFSAKAQRDFALVARILSHRDEQACTQLVQAYQQPIYQLVARLVPQRDIAEDLTLEVFMRAFRYLPRGVIVKATTLPFRDLSVLQQCMAGHELQTRGPS